MLGEVAVIDQPGEYTLTVDAVWCDTECADCRAEIKAGDVIGLRPVEGSKGVSLSLCEACVRKELARRATWVRETLPGARSACGGGSRHAEAGRRDGDAGCGTGVSNVTLLTPRAEPKVIEVLRDLLGRAERGEIIAIAVAAQLSGQQESGSAYAVGERGSDAYLIGAIEMVKLRILGVIEA